MPTTYKYNYDDFSEAGVTPPSAQYTNIDAAHTLTLTLSVKTEFMSEKRDLSMVDNIT